MTSLLLDIGNRFFYSGCNGRLKSMNSYQHLALHANVNSFNFPVKNKKKAVFTYLFRVDIQDPHSYIVIYMCVCVCVYICVCICAYIL